MAKNFVSNLIIRTKDETTAVVNRVGGAFKSLGGIVAGVAAGLATAFSVRSISNFLSGATKEAGEFGKQIAIVGNISGATGEDLAKLRATAEQLGSSTAFSASEAAQGMEALARAGLNAQETISTIPSVLALAQGQSLELGQAASFITQTMAGLGLGVDQAGRAADVLAKGAQSANQNVEQLGNSLSFAAPAARALGVDLETTVALISKLADAGLAGSRAGTALNNVFLQFKNPASKFRQELAAIGIDTDDFIAALDQLAAAGVSGEKALLSLGQEAGPAIRILVGQAGGAIGELTQQLREAQGTAQESADVFANELPGAFAGLRSAWEAVRNSLGTSLVEPVKREVNGLADAVRNFVNSDNIEKLKAALVDGFENGVKAIKAFMAEFGSFDETMTRAIDGVRGLSEGFGKLSNAAIAAGNGIKAVFQAINSIISGLATGISAAVTVIVGVVNGLIQALNSVGLASDLLALKSEAAVETLREMTFELGKRTVQAAKDSADAAGKTVAAIGRLGEGAERAAEQAGKLGQALSEFDETAAQRVERLASQVATLESEIQSMVAAGADMESVNAKFRELGEVMEQLETAEAAASVEEVAAATTAAGKAAEGAQKGFTDMAAVLRQGSNVAVDLGGELAKLRQQYDEGKISAKDYASNVAGLSSALRDLTIDQLSREMANLGKQFREGKISAEELRIATELVNQEFQRQAVAAREARRANNDLASGNRDLAKSYQDVAKSAGEAGEVVERLDKIIENTNKRGGRQARAFDIGSMTNLSGLRQLLIEQQRLPPQQGEYFIRTQKEYQNQIEDRIKQLEEEKRIADLRRELELKDLEARRNALTAAPAASASRGPISINVGGVLDVNDRATLDSLARKLQPILRDIERRSV